MTSGRIERIVVPLDAASDCRLAIDTAARLAARVKLRLHGAFVEDEELLQAASLHFTRQSTFGAAAAPFTRERMSEELRDAAQRARRDLAAAAERHQLAWSFEVLRGRSEQVLASATERDLVVAGGFSRPVAGYFRLASRWFDWAEAATGPFLLARHAWHAEGAVVAVLRDRRPEAVRLLAAAAQIAEARGGILTVIAPPATAAAAPDFGEWLRERLAAYRVPLQIEAAPAALEMLEQRIVELGCRLLAVEARSEDSNAVRLREFAERFTCDILVVR
jgi:nucleotide-binding universal stress UspA family protein